MKKFSKGIIGAIFAAVAIVACLQDPHAADREQNALIGTQHQISLEVCLKQASMAKHSDADAGEIRADFEKCMADADKFAGEEVMDKVAIVAQFLIAIAEPLAKLIMNAASDSYDKDTELQALLSMQDKIAEERFKRIMES